MARYLLTLTKGLFIASTAVCLSVIALTAQAADPEREYSRGGADTCLNCHDGETIPLVFMGKHGNASDANSPMGGLQCEACHGPLGDHRKRPKKGEERVPMIRFGKDSGTPVAEQNGMCLGCHDSHIGGTWDGSPHDSQEISCADCHQSHAARDPMTVPEQQPERCFECHRTERAASFKPYAHPIRFDAMSCSQCHSPHGSVSDKLLVKESTNLLCYSCHADKRGPFLWEHAPVAEDCTLCHDAHGSNHDGMLTRRPPQLCQQCHSQAGHPSVALGGSGLPGSGTGTRVSGACMNCHSQVHGSNHPSGAKLMR
jgi:DmsE family decaheme c-type cytochrome